MGSGALPLAITTKSSKQEYARAKALRVYENSRSARGALAGSAMHVAGRKEFQADRAIRIGKLNALPRFHIRPIDVVVYHGSSGRPRLEGGFPLRCIQRLSRPHIATRRCRWRDNRYTRGASIPVLSY